MNANEPIMLKLPSGEPREVRWTAAASRRVRNAIGSKAIKDMSDDEMVEAIYYMLYDEQGNAPPISVDEWLEKTPADPDAIKEIAAVFIAVTQGLEKKIVLAKIEGAFQSFRRIIGSSGTDSPVSVSDSADKNSGTAIPFRNSKYLDASGEGAKILQTTGQESPPQP